MPCSPLELVAQSISFPWMISCQMVAGARWKIRYFDRLTQIIPAVDCLCHERQVSKLYASGNHHAKTGRAINSMMQEKEF